MGFCTPQLIRFNLDVDHAPVDEKLVDVVLVADVHAVPGAGVPAVEEHVEEAQYLRHCHPSPRPDPPSPVMLTELERASA